MAPRRNPIPTLTVLALLPALALGGCWRYAADRVPESTSAGVDDAVALPAPSPLASPLLSFRRAPGVLSRDVNLEAFRAAATPFLERIGDGSCVAISVDGVPVAAKNERIPLRPASNVKLLTAAVAAEVLGLQHSFTTEVRGVLAGGVVSGDLYLVGGGDPVLNNAWWNGPNAKFPPFNSTSVEEFADRIVAAGVTRIEGSVIGDASRYDDEWYNPTWFDDVKFVEGGPISALLISDSRESPTASSNDPVVGAAAVLTAELRNRGVVVAGNPGKGAVPGATPVIAAITSLPLPAVIAEVLTTSDNTAAEMLLKEIGFVRSAFGTRQAGIAVVLQTLQSWGVPTEGVQLVDGSGLSDENRLTCAALLALLQHQSPDDAVGAGLPVAGAAGGTLAEAFADTPMAGLLRAKTGTLYNYDDGIGGRPAVKALSGYVPLDGGGAIEFSLLLTGPQIAEQVEYRPIWDAFAELLGGYPSGPSPAVLAPGGAS